MGTLNRNGNASTTARVYKALTLFSGTQSIGILCSVIRTKLVAVWIGAAGVGLFGLCNTAIEMFAALTQLNLRTTAVRDLAAIAPTSPSRRILAVVVRRWALLLGLGGMMLMALLSPWLANISFGDQGKWWIFAALSPVMLMGSVTNGQQAIMQADGNLRAIAKASVWGVAVALIASVPLLWYLRMNGIVPVIAIYALTTLIATLFCKPKYSGNEVHVSLRHTVKAGQGFLRLGLYMTVSGFMVWGASYFLMSWLTAHGGEETAGYYQAGNTLLIRYAGVLFTAIGMEYYPRIAAVAHDCRRVGVYVGHEILILLRIAVPLALIFSVSAPLIVRLLYSSDFEVIVPYVTIGTVGLIARIGAFCISYMMIVRSDGVLFMITESVSTVVFLILNIAFYTRWGVTGFGIAFTLWYLFYLGMVWIICRIRYRLHINKKAVALLLTALIFACIIALTCLAYRY